MDKIALDIDVIKKMNCQQLSNANECLKITLRFGPDGKLYDLILCPSKRLKEKQDKYRDVRSENELVIATYLELRGLCESGVTLGSMDFSALLKLVRQREFVESELGRTTTASVTADIKQVLHAGGAEQAG